MSNFSVFFGSLSPFRPEFSGKDIRAACVQGRIFLLGTTKCTVCCIVLARLLILQVVEGAVKFLCSSSDFSCIVKRGVWRAASVPLFPVSRLSERPLRLRDTEVWSAGVVGGSGGRSGTGRGRRKSDCQRDCGVFTACLASIAAEGATFVDGW